MTNRNQRQAIMPLHYFLLRKRQTEVGAADRCAHGDSQKQIPAKLRFEFRWNGKARLLDCLKRVP